jgi:uncharacterized protein YjbI with pentapeptide repeats
LRPDAMIQPKPAAVKPRVVCPQSGETVPLESVVHELLNRGCRQQICLWGPAGSGTTTALEHLAAALPPGANVSLVDGDAPPAPFRPGDALVVYTSKPRRPESDALPTAMYRLAPWSTDDAVEYLLARHKPRCASVMGRLQAATDLDALNGLAELWCIVLDAMADDDALRDANSALKAYLNRHLVDPKMRSLAQTYCLTSLKGSESIPLQYADRLRAGGCDDVLRALRHRAMQVLLAAERVVADLKSRDRCDYLTGRVPRALIKECAHGVAGERIALSHLHRLARNDPLLQPVAASILHATPGGWKPTGNRVCNLSGAYLDDAHWPRVRLATAELSRANLSHADLTYALLQRAVAETADFQHARLRSASLEHLQAAGANFSHADLSKAHARAADFAAANFTSANCEAAFFCEANLHNADLSGASFARADLTRATLVGAEIDATDFSGANLRRAVLARLSLRKAHFTGARFVEADLRWVDLEYVELPGVLFEKANLEEAALTGSIMPKANFAGANLRNAGLADVEWEGVNLRDADLRDAAFHMGSSRSGLVGGPIASEGTRTGFYTDEYEELHYKAAEEIRKANLCGADLRGAQIDDVDFYLVDLRDARYGADQEVHLRRCGAILDRQNR